MIEFSYIHIPFCAAKCKYCAFVSFLNSKFIEKYVSALLFQIEKEYDNTPQKTLYIGGGTPSLLEISQVQKIIEKFNFKKNPEITFEINPENASPAYLKGLLNLGVNRLSIGAQTFNDTILEKIGRRHKSSDTFSAVHSAQKAGFKNISIDLMYGLPEEDLKTFQNDLKIANNLNITHISTYGLKIEEHTFFGKFPPKNLPDEDIQAKMYKTAIRDLTNFQLYEISNFAKSRKYQSRHNLSYWNLASFNAFGISASGFNQKTRYKNTSSIQKYLDNPLLKEEIIKTTQKSLLEEEIFLGFRKCEGINVLKINKKYGIDFEKKFSTILKKYKKTGHILKTERGYRLSISGILVSNYILCDFLC